jgi:hypothetical protein
MPDAQLARARAEEGPGGCLTGQDAAGAAGGAEGGGDFGEGRGRGGGGGGGVGGS